MRIGLTNAPSTFWVVMNKVFQRYLRKIVIIFFDDILIYNTSVSDHVKHLEIIFEILKENHLLAKNPSVPLVREIWDL